MPSKSRKTNQSKKQVVQQPVEQVTQSAEPVVEQQAVEQQAVEQPAVQQSKKRTRKATPSAEPAVEQTEQPVKAAKQTRRRKVVQQTETDVEPQVTEAVTETATESTTDGRRTRSFKVMLPSSENYEGRFTGLTPYQAANKALSSYYKSCKKNNTEAQSELEFSIRESTRGSSHKVYTYRGARVPLDAPVEYEIKQKDGSTRVITKEYKNRLTKVKKSETTTTETA